MPLGLDLKQEGHLICGKHRIGLVDHVPTCAVRGLGALEFSGGPVVSCQFVLEVGPLGRDVELLLLDFREKSPRCSNKVWWRDIVGSACFHLSRPRFFTI